MVSAKFNSNSRGFSLIEVVISMGLLTTVALGVARLFAMSTKANLTARGTTSTTMMAAQRLEQLRSLTWGFDLEGMGLPVTDSSTNFAVTPPAQNGTGLNPSPTTSLDVNTAGFVDFLDQNGAWVGTGTTVPTAAVYIRRWSIQPLPTNPNNTIIIQVLVTPVSSEARRLDLAVARTRLRGDSLLTSLKTRKAS